jgi:hypothetical protein
VIIPGAVEGAKEDPFEDNPRCIPLPTGLYEERTRKIGKTQGRRARPAAVLLVRSEPHPVSSTVLSEFKTQG